MKVDIIIPSPGESITEVELANWLAADGSWVEKDQEIAEIESEKATLPLMASHSGILSIKVQGGTVRVGEVACTIDTDAKKPKGLDKVKEITNAEEESKEKPKEKIVVEEKKVSSKILSTEKSKVKVTPLAQKIMDDKGFDVDDIINGLRKITSDDVNRFIVETNASNTKNRVGERSEERLAMSQLRKKLSQRLVAVKNQTAMLTTFNEVDMSRIISIRKEYQKHFQEKYDIKLGFMSFFTRAVVEALKLYPMVNSFIDGDEIVTPNYYDIGIAVQTPKGLMVPVIRNAEDLSMAQIETNILELAQKGEVGRIGLDDLTGGTFTITNGGVFGSMLSTPILNPPQSAILGMHNILERPIAVNGKVEVRPMMYIALSYDHRVIDGKDSVGFLVKVKQMLENPELMVFKGNKPEKLLLGL
ncbi:MAG: 2-oxoglutarate dehydrogenase complex dihydrolipoyllysine-residue succinyltransferase [Bacteroidales bacterium]|nr:2-oxoglutarate dehydrogenase complex dihydrolipoyllysine-residue succinyltransferase [Bacteroidales bacterium]MDD3891869.1 2-oxoglutarate dehydrogenase complex dihydrolipoyllysine-residue succinyltransferase [Bacteroidales bacterium]